MAKYNTYVLLADLTTSARSLNTFGREKGGVLIYRRHADTEGAPAQDFLRSSYPASAIENHMSGIFDLPVKVKQIADHMVNTLF